ncbi:hypothetical protein CXF96_08435 [Stenotrophomonas sp. Betaine-02u-21]|uniref:acyltransferase n=1 Tax=unclassified Stenotrophomonas TaxID=196198 RepID=UPI000C323503|nr:MULTISPECIES: acyltransferase [unclassified Stenotrophomonas]PKH70108.1 hypothetical protein CXF90_16035 [Stenotrophomonas sp. Betaine-02u-23]PKH74329.1 hypothetical protein CXF96_08435 [Stenotrophomonas sp. Betaine-02u-21]PKH96538.1 hypothetical protein CXG43_06470 [Stenotrophomonas sp. Bg11-02]
MNTLPKRASSEAIAAYEGSARSLYWDCWKGIAIIAVVIIHACASFSDFPPISANGISGLIIRQVVNFAVPLFFALSGYFAGNLAAGSPIDYYVKRIGRVFWPYAVWTIAYLCIRALDEQVSILTVVKGFIFGTGIGIGYFVVVLLQFILLTPILLAIKTPSRHLGTMLTIMLMGLSFTYCFPALQPDHPISSFPFYALPFFVWYPFYHLGLFISRYKSEGEIQEIPAHVIWIALAITAIFAFLESLYWLLDGGGKFATSQLKASNFLYAIALFVAAIRFERSNSMLHRSRALAWLGANSFAIYLIHMLLLAPIARALSTVRSLFMAQPLYVLACATATLLACSLIISCLRRLLPARAGRIILG